MTLQTEVLASVTSDFLKQMSIIKSFNSVLNVNVDGVNKFRKSVKIVHVQQMKVMLFYGFVPEKHPVVMPK